MFISQFTMLLSQLGYSHGEASKCYYIASYHQGCTNIYL